MDGVIQESMAAGGGRQLDLFGSFDLDSADEFRAELVQRLRGGSVERIDLSGVDRLEGSAASVLLDVLCASETVPSFGGASPDVQSILDLHTAAGMCPARLPRAPRDPFLNQIGRATLEIVGTVTDMLAFLGQASGALVQAVRRPASVAWRGVFTQVERHGADGLPIVCVIGGLMGLITAFQAAVQLSKFGADTFVANLVSLSLTRELAPLMTAIVVAGRSGAAIAAEIGTMKVSEEVDALYTLGICPHRYLVFPRILALVIALPLLTLVADLVGILCGAAVVTMTLEVSFRQFLVSTQEALVPMDVMSGLIKATVFGGIIAGIACERGLAAGGGAAGVGRVTTSAVVSTLFWLVFVDALFAVFFNVWGIQ